MAVPPSATFHYVTEIPEGAAKTSPWQMKSAEPFRPTGDSLRLVGWEPLLYISDAGMTPNPNVSKPAVFRNQLRLVATDTEYASQESVSYFFDKALVHTLRPGDAFHMVRTDCCGFGASVIRQGKLIFAVGEVTAVPLGSGIQVRTPTDLTEKAEKIFRQRDQKFEFLELPIEVRCGAVSRIVYHGIEQLGGYHVWVEHGFFPCLHGIPACVSISLDGACDWVAASATAQLLNTA